MSVHCPNPGTSYLAEYSHKDERTPTWWMVIDMATKNELTPKLVGAVSSVSEDIIQFVLTQVLNILEVMTVEDDDEQVCPYCGKTHVVRNGKKHGKQRFLCKDCNRTFVETTNTIMYNSHKPGDVWARMIQDTLAGEALSHSEKELGISHTCAFNMRHKILMAMQAFSEEHPTVLSGTSELDETYVLESYKGRKLPEGVERAPRKHGAKAQKPGLSNEQICICTGIQRDGQCFAETVNRAKPSNAELKEVFKGRIEPGTLVFCDGLKGYKTLEDLTQCIVRGLKMEEFTAVMHLNNVNGFHSAIKDQYNFYRGVATKYQNRYNALFGNMYATDRKAVATKIFDFGCRCTSINRYHTNGDVRRYNLLAI